MKELLSAFFYIGFAVALWQDLRTCRVYNLVWWISGPAAFLLLCLEQRGHVFALIPELLLFGIIQRGLFARWYGLADCYAFMVCSLMKAAQGAGIRDYLFQMLIAFMLLAVVQLLRRNVAEDGNLKSPVPFLPYIFLAYFVPL